MDQNLELEVLKAEKETTSENLQAEHAQYLKELESVRSSLTALSTSNVRLSDIIKSKAGVVDTQASEIHKKSQSIDTLSKKVSKTMSNAHF